MYYKQPRYFGDFHCIGNKCIETCCYGWRIRWTKDEVDKVLGAENISDELSELIKKSFIPNNLFKDELEIEFLDNGRCPFETEDRLCRIQKELGAEYLSNTCATYPRNNIYSKNAFYRFCRITCPVVIEELLNNEKSMDLISLSGEKDDGKYLSAINDWKETEKRPEQGYRAEIFDFLYELIADKRYKVEDTLIMGALAAQRLTQAVGREDYDSIPHEIKLLRKQLRSPEVQRSIQKLQANPQIKMRFLSEIVEDIAGNASTLTLHDKNGTFDPDLYDKGTARLNDMLKGHEYFFRNVALQLLFELDVPFKIAYKTIFENYSLFAAIFGSIQLNLIAAMAVDKLITMYTFMHEFRYDGFEKITGLTALVSRGLCQNTARSEEIIDLLVQHEFTRPAFLAVLIK